MAKRRRPANERETTLELECEDGSYLARVRGTYVPGSPAVGPSWDCGGEPEEPPTIEDIEVSTDGGQTWLPPEDAGVSDADVERAIEEMLED